MAIGKLCMKPRTRLINPHKSLYNDAHISGADHNLYRCDVLACVLELP
jgi:hypothetical protein